LRGFIDVNQPAKADLIKKGGIVMNRQNETTLGLMLSILPSLVLTFFISAPSARAAGASCGPLPGFGQLQSALEAVVSAGNNGGLGNDMWATVVNRDGIVCAVVFTGSNRSSAWPGSRVISAQKAYTANAFSRRDNVIGFAGPLSTANLYTAVQPGGSLFGLQHSNPVDPSVAYSNNPANYGKKNDPMVGNIVGGVNVFGGGLALYNRSGDLVGGLGVSGDTSCSDHIIAWKVRHDLNLDNVPTGVSPTGDDNIIFTPLTPLQAAFAHPDCAPVGNPKPIAEALPTTHPIGPNP
jgi:uncharacterized protein GlcG (DUF336 family)